MDKLFDSNADDATFLASYQAAKKAGVPEEILFESRLTRDLQADSHRRLALLLPEAEKIFPDADLAQSKVFNRKEDIQGMLFALRAVDAEQKGDTDGFKSNVLQAFWLSPPLAQILGHWVSAEQLKARIAQVTLPMDLPIKASDGSTTTLAQLVKGHKAVLLDFWASWCGPCMANMPELKVRGAKLPGEGVVVAAMNEEGDLGVADGVKKQLKMTIPWLVEPAGNPLSVPLEIDSIPRAVLIGSDGKILFDGHPQDDDLPAALAAIGAPM